VQHDVALRDGLDEHDRDAAADLLWDAFADKLGTALGDAARGRRFLSQTLDADMCLSAHDATTGDLLGVLVWGRADHAGPGGEVAALWRTYGLSSVWRLALLATLESTPSKGALYVESISVSATARGRGVGSALLARAHQLAIDSRLRCVELEVVDTNPRAHALYARLGYADVKHSRMPWPLSRWIGIKATTLMRLDVGDGQSII
jgi:ribosomal protein S18 acetylase RimI-like enzyme